jgi:lactoylglutathione lyase
MRKIVLITIVIVTMSIESHSQKPTFDHLAIIVANFEKSAAFYKDIIGLDTIPNPFRDNKHIWFSIGAGLELHIIAGGTLKPAHQLGNHFCLSMPSVEEFIQTLARANIPYQNAIGEKDQITIRPDGVKQIYFTDPDGNWIEINDVKKK